MNSKILIIVPVTLRMRSGSSMYCLSLKLSKDNHYVQHQGLVQIVFKLSSEHLDLCDPMAWEWVRVTHMLSKSGLH